jgi:hypothetical protein
VARTREGGLAALAETAQLNREHLYRTPSEDGKPELRSLEALLDALGFRLSVESKATGGEREVSHFPDRRRRVRPPTRRGVER